MGGERVMFNTVLYKHECYLLKAKSHGTLFAIMNIKKSYRRPLAVAVFLHIALFSALALHWVNKSYQMPGPVAKQQPEIVQATAISQRQIDQQIHHIKHQEQLKHAAELRHLKQLHDQALAAKRERIKEQQHLKALKVKQQQLKHQQKLAKERKIKELAVKQQQLQSKIMQQQMQQEQQRLAAIHARQMQGVVDKYRAQILQKLHGYWHTPKGIDPKLHCEYAIKLAPNGIVLSATLIKSSGNSVLDRVARTTILKASPLPVPKDAAIFNEMREINLIMTPGESDFQWGKA